jgi:hypothetical protein
MNRKASFGPWVTLIDAGRNPQLGAFWRRRLGMLLRVTDARCDLSRRQVPWLAAAALVVCLAPTVRALPVLAEQSEAAPAVASGSGVGTGT